MDTTSIELKMLKNNTGIIQSSSHPSDNTRFEHQFNGKKTYFSPVGFKTRICLYVIKLF